MRTKKKLIAGLCFMLCLLMAAAAEGGTKTFPAGSYIIPQDICWQPNKDTKIDTSYSLTGCDTNKNDQGLFQSTGLIYDVLNAGFPIYWLINPNKTSMLTTDCSINKSGAAPAVTIYHSAMADSGSLTTVKYIGGPFVIDANDMAPEIQAIFDKYTNAKIHKSNYDFSAEVDKVLSGKPPKVAVLNEGSVDVLTDYFFASGLGNTMYDIFEYVTSPQIVAGVLKDYQLLWAPHWVIDSQSPVAAADRPKVVTAVRNFLEAGNAGFFECASIQSFERGYDHKQYGGTFVSPSAYYAGSGFLLDKTYSDVNGRIETNGTALSKTTLVFEYPTNVLTQCGGWNFLPTSGVTEDIRPSQLANPDYVYNSTVQRFIHDTDTPFNATTAPNGITYAPKGYDYYVGGRINGNATQGYVAYLGGHKYVQCTNTTVATPVTRRLSLEFNADLDHSGNITVEVAYSGCSNAGTPASTCPKATFSLTSMSGSSGTDASGKMYIDLDSAVYGPDADPATKFILSDIVVGNKDAVSGKTITAIYVTFDGNPTTTLLTNMLDMTSGTAATICSPNSQSPATCPEPPKKVFNFNFGSALVTATTTVTIQAQYGTCTLDVVNAAGTITTPGTCPKGSFDLSTNIQTSGSDGTVKVDMDSVTYDSVNKKLNGVLVYDLSTSANQTLQKFQVVFTGNGATQLTTVQDVTTTPSTACTANGVSPAICPTITITPVISAAEFDFSTTIPNGSTISISATYGGGTTSPTASYTVAATPVKVSAQDANIKIDMSSAAYAVGKLTNVKLTNLTGANYTITAFNVSWTGGGKITTIKVDGSSVWTGNRSSAYTAGVTKTLAVNTSGTPMSISLTKTPAPISLVFGNAVSSCTVDWTQTNTCGMKYVLNTLIGLQFQVIPHEYAKAGAIQKDNILYRGTYEYPGYKGHLSAIDVKSNPSVLKWDAGKPSVMPAAGSANPATPSQTSNTRYIFTNIAGSTTKVNFDVNNAGTLVSDTTKLWYYLDPAKTKTLNAVKALINSVRGRKNASDVDVNGTGDVSKRLGGIEHSSAAIMPKSKLAGSATRDKVVFVGGDDGMLHALYAGSWDSSLNAGAGGYTAGTGKEIWAYIPSTLLGSLQNQTFTDCSPGESISGCVPDISLGISCVCPIFTVAVTVDGSPAIGDFFVDHDNNPATAKQWRTIVVATAKVLTPGDATQSVNQGIIFALDVTNPYAPSVLWERTYNTSVNTLVAPGNAITRNYYPSATFPASYPYRTGEGTSFDPNMGDAKGVAIGRVQVGTTLDTYVFVTSRWVRQADVGPSGTPHKVWGLSVYALDFYSGDIVWETKIAYTGDAEGVNEPPATPALLDYGNNGTFDYLVAGDMQGRLWVLNTSNGATISSSGNPAYDVGKGAKEPIGVPVAILNKTIVFGTGGRDSLQDENNTPYHIYAIQINSKGEVKDLWVPAFALNNGEKVWSSPVIDDNGTVYVGTAKGYTDVGRPDQIFNSSGRFLAIELGTGMLKKDSLGNEMKLDLGGAVIGDIAVESSHVTVQLFNGTSVQIGESATTSFNSADTARNPVRVLWWRKL